MPTALGGCEAVTAYRRQGSSVESQARGAQHARLDDRARRIDHELEWYVRLDLRGARFCGVR